MSFVVVWLLPLVGISGLGLSPRGDLELSCDLVRWSSISSLPLQFAEDVGRCLYGVQMTHSESYHRFAYRR